jgi:hypothetical protein
MQARLSRYRWWLLLLVAVAGLGSWFLWPISAMREKYDRIRLGMTRAEVIAIMGPEQSQAESGRALERWNRFESEPSVFDRSSVRIDEHAGFWYEPSGVYIDILYSHDKVVLKMMQIRMTELEVKARDWLDWLRGPARW